MINIKDKLIVSIVNESFEKIIEFANVYKKIELRLNQLYLNNEQILKVIDSSDLVVITDIAELDSTNSFHKINFSNNQLEKIFIDCPVEKIENENLIKYIENPNLKKILSYHQWSHIENIENIFTYFLEKKEINISKYFIIKIAVLLENIDEINTLFSLFTKYPDVNFILIPLGKKNQKMRIKSIEFGSKYAFCYVNNPVTDCQLHYKDYEYYFCS
jgi:3-dehydroquinate dehydratase